MRTPADRRRIEFLAQGGACIRQHCRRDRDADEFCRGLGQNRPIANSEECQAKIGEAIPFDNRLRRQADNGVIAVPPREFAEKMHGVFSRDRQFDGNQQFFRRQRRLINSGEEILRRDPPFSGLAANDDGRIQRHHAGRQLRCRIGMREAPAQRTPVADRGMRDMGNRLGEQRRMRGNFGRPRKIDMTRQRANPEKLAVHRNAAQLGEFADIDDEFGGDQPQVHRGHQALAARKHFCPVAVRGQQFQRIRDAGCACVSESRSFQWRDLPGRILAHFLRLDGGDHQRSSYRAIISDHQTFGLVMMA